MGRLAPLALAALSLAACHPCPRSGADECVSAAVSPAALRAASWLLDAEAFGRRDAPGPGADRAAHYVAAELQAAGLRPGGDRGTYLQEVPLTVVRPTRSSLAVLQANVELTLAPERDFQVLEAHGQAQVKIDAEVALADGARPAAAPGLRGRVALVTVRTPDEVQLATTTVAALRDAGAVGVLLCTRGPKGRDAYAKLREQLTRPVVLLADAGAGAAGTGASDARLVVALAPPACEQLLATAAGGRRDAGPAPALRIRAQARLERQAARTWNAVGVYDPPGTPTAPPLVVAARLDGPGVDLAALLDAGRALARLQARPPRRVVLLAAAGAPGAPVGVTRFLAPGAAPPLLIDLGRVAPERVPAATARLVTTILRGADRVSAP